MTPKEKVDLKVKELIDRMEYYQPSSGWGSLNSKMYAIECAILACGEVINELKYGLPEESATPKIEFWQAVLVKLEEALEKENNRLNDN